jgi:hypothetical protein
MSVDTDSIRDPSDPYAETDVGNASGLAAAYEKAFH